MYKRWNLIGSLALLGAVLVAGEVNAQTTVTYGRITAVRQVDIQNQGAQCRGHDRWWRTRRSVGLRAVEQ